MKDKPKYMVTIRVGEEEATGIGELARILNARLVDPSGADPSCLRADTCLRATYRQTRKQDPDLTAAIDAAKVVR